MLAKVLERRSLDVAQMVAGGIRNRYVSDPERVMAGLAAWSQHADEFARVAAGVALGTITVRNPDALHEVMPLVEQLANDRSSVVRDHGAVGALEIVWLYHYDQIGLLIEDWIERKNDLVRKVVLLTMGKIVRENKINRPSTLKQFIERATALCDRLLTAGNPELRPAIAAAMNDFGMKAPDLVLPWVKEWANRSDLNALSLARELLGLPFGDFCRELDKNMILGRASALEEDQMKRIAAWLRQGRGRVDYFTIIVDRILTFVGQGPFRYWADPYRGCQFRCEFCFSRGLSEYAGETEEDFVRRIVVVANAAEVLSRELSSPEWRRVPGRVVKLGMTSDPYQAAEEKFGSTGEMLKVLLEKESPVIVHTRSALVLRDLDIFEKLAERGLVNVLVSIPTPIEGIRAKVEPGIPSVSERLGCIEALSRRGVPVGLVASPLFPYLTDHPEAIEELIRRGAEAGAAFVVPEVLRLDGTARAKARFFIESFIPDLLGRFDELYQSGGDGLLPTEEYVTGLTHDLIPQLAEKYGANRTGLMLRAPEEKADYMAPRE
jgi:DNA repair photolyase